MCRNIKPLFNFEPPATRNEIHDAALQFVRKISGYNTPSKTNEAAFHEAVEDIEKVMRKLLKSLDTSAPPKDREVGRPPGLFLGHFAREYRHDTGAFCVCCQHDSAGLRLGHMEFGLEQPHHEFAWRIIVIEQNNLVQRGFSRLQHGFCTALGLGIGHARLRGDWIGRWAERATPPGR